MNIPSRLPRVLASAVTCAAALAGCASTAVTTDALQRNTAFALGLDASAFTISDRVDEGVKTTYRVTTRGGRLYSCYVTGVVSMTGRVVSDALCNEIARPGAAREPNRPAGRPAAPPNCNALLKAAGRC
ncbi:hypothetical protein [Xenophilus azovorans]|uniref:hypothetical protein n=1 Tax=Xenophilus azovorans TaxID=151755 RepID=UPI00056DC5C7|nr:hypothetical protein [Xenophilus azovorans]